MARIDKTKLDITKTNAAIDELLRVTVNPRHIFMLQAFYRHRFLEIAGRFPEIFTADMTVEHPVYNFNYAGIVARLEGADAVKELYGHWTQTHQTIFYAEHEQVAVADNYIMSVADVYQQTLGKTLATNGIKVDDENAYYLYKTKGLQQIWPYDDRCRLIGEDVWETSPKLTEVIKLDPADVMTNQQAATLLNPLIKPLPQYNEATMGRTRLSA